MKFIHLSDLHLGKRLNEFSLIEDQEYILKEILSVIDEEKPDGILIAGDVYDKSVPSEEAMELWDFFLTALAGRGLPVYAISGNHDSAIRFADHSELVSQTGIHLCRAYDGSLQKFTVTDQNGPLNIYMLPFVKPVIVRHFFPEEEIESYTDACRVAISHMNPDPAERNLLIAHQFVTGASTCDSEERSVGGLDNVDASVFDAFDYVALGHIHGPQAVGRETIRYCGTPLKYSFSEKDHEKSLTLVEFGAKGQVAIRAIPLTPRYDLREVRGTYEELTLLENYEHTNREDYIHVVLTDEDDVPNAMAKLRVIYPKLMKLTYDNQRTRGNRTLEDIVNPENKTELEFFEEFFEVRNNRPMDQEQLAYMTELIKTMKGE